MSYRIASFNLFKFNYKSDKESKKSFDNIAKIICENKFDIVALQEVVSESALRQCLIPVLNRMSGVEWRYKWEAPRYLTKDIYKNRFEDKFEQGLRVKGYSKSKNEAEGYAFIWREDKFTLPEKYRNGYSTTVFPRIFNQYRVDSSKGQQPLARNPYFGRFIPLDGTGNRKNIELRLINTHITYGETGNGKPRAKELEIIFDQIYKRASSFEIPREPIYTIILGDYNLNLKRPWNNAPFLESFPGVSMEYFDIMELQRDPNGIQKLVKIKRVRTEQESKSTIKQPNRENFDPNDGFANNYDHFTFDETYRASSSFLSNARVLNQESFIHYKTTEGKNDFSKFKREISDHLPIYIDINI